MTLAPAPAAEPRRTCGGAGGVGRAQEVLPPWHGQKIKLAKRLWGAGLYSHAAVRYAAQIIALDQRSRGCRAGVLTLAGYMGDSERTAERRLAELAAEQADGITAMTVRRHTAPGGTGITAERRMRRPTAAEHFAYVPVGAAKALRPIAFVAYCALAYAEATRTPMTAAELGALLGVTERSARRLVDELEALGWTTVDRRTGHQGRNEVTVHDHPLHPVPDAPEPLSPDGGSGPDTNGGSLAIKEDTGLTDTRKTTADAGGSFRRRRDDGKWVGPSSDRPVTPVAPADAPATFRPARPMRPAERPERSVARSAYAGPALTLGEDAWKLLAPVLAPVQDLLPGCSAFVQRRIVREILRQIREDGIWPDDIRDQVQRMRDRTPPETITDPGRWLLGAVLPPRPGPCGRTDCHHGFLRWTGTPCKACEDLPATAPPTRGRGHPPPTALQECPNCAAPYRPPLRHPNCRLCHTPLPATGT